MHNTGMEEPLNAMNRLENELFIAFRVLVDFRF